MSDFSINDNGLAVITLSRPPVNAFDDTLLDFVSEALQTLEMATDVGALLIKAEGKHFSAGADMKYISDWGEGAEATDKLVAFSSRLQDTFLRVANLPFPSIAALHGGTTAGAGFELALACDLRVVARDAKMGLPEVRYGWIASAGGTQRLTARIGKSAALRLMVAEEFIGGEDAYRLGIADWLVDAEDVIRTATEIGDKIASYPRAAVRAIKDLTQPDRGDGLAKELYYTRLLEYEKTSHGLVKQFLNKKT